MKRSFAADERRHAPRILLASYYFPPDAAVGGLRAAKFVRALPEFGWEPLVITVRDEHREQGFDHERMKGLERSAITRTGEFPRVWRRIKSALPELLYSRRGLTSRVSSGENVLGGAPGGAAFRETLRARVKRWIVSVGVLLPDDKKHWAVPAALTTIGLIRRHGIDYVLTSGPPFSTHLIGLAAKVCTKAKWIADFRDPWIDMLPDRFAYTRSALSDFLERRMEALVATVADTVTVTTPQMQAAFRTRYRRVPPDRFVCITNSIDTAAFQQTSARARSRPDRPLTITYAGSLYFHRTPEPLFQAVGDLVRSGRIAEHDIRIRLVGQCRSIDGIDTRRVAQRHGLNTSVEVLDPVPYVEVVRMLQESHLLLVLAPEHHRLVVPAKVYDYLGSGSKLLAIADPGATSDLVRETKSGDCFAPSDVAGLSEYLCNVIKEGNYRDMRNAPESFWRYDAHYLTGRLVAEMAGAAPPRPAEVAVRE